MSEWIKHDGKGMPVDGDARVYVRWAHEEREDDLCSPASLWNVYPNEWVWRYDDGSMKSPYIRITHYRIIDNKED